MVEVIEWVARGRGHSHWCLGTPTEGLPMREWGGMERWLSLSLFLCCHFMQMKQEKQRPWEIPMENKKYFHLAEP